jgi:hypothetical protein
MYKDYKFLDISLNPSMSTSFNLELELHEKTRIIMARQDFS